MQIEVFLMTHKTKGIILRTIKYGETSLIATTFTELFGVQTYLVNGVRKIQPKGGKIIMLQPGALLDMEVYHNELKNMQRLKDCNWSLVYTHLLSDVIKNSVLTFMMELLFKTVRQPESDINLFDFCEDSLIYLDKCKPSHTANFALYFSLQLPQFFGFKIESPSIEKTSQDKIYLDLKEGKFENEKPLHHHFIEGELALQTIELLKIMHPDELDQIKLNKEIRRNLLLAYLEYFSLHLNDFGQMKSLKIMQEVLS